MLEIVQAGQVGKTRFLFDMHRLRKRVFHDRQGWDVTITPGGLEVDQYDHPETVYLLALNHNSQVIGNWRLLPTSGPIMIREVWPQFLETIHIPHDPYAWETSRFAIEASDPGKDDGLAQVNRATQELFCGLTELCIMCGIHTIYTMYNMHIARLLKRLDCAAQNTSARHVIAEATSEVGQFTTDEAMLGRLRKATGIHYSLISPDMLPPVLQPYYQRTTAAAPRPRNHAMMA